MPDRPDKKNAADVRAICLVAMTYTVLPLLMIPLAFVLIGATTLANLRRLRAATDRCEKNHWRLCIAAHLLFAYGGMLLTLLAVDRLLGEPWKLSEWWPLMSKSAGWLTNQAVIVMLDVLAALGVALIALGAARYFGYVDENEVWHAPGRVLRRRRMAGDLLAKGAPEVRDKA